LPAKAKPKKNLSAMKRARQAVKRNLRNRTIRSTVKTILKKLESSIASGNRENAASRNISRFTKKVNAFLKAGAA
jgi:ribosomal protein S20